jgi:hypothetical protein
MLRHVLCVLVLALLVHNRAAAQFTSAYTFDGHGNWSIDAIGYTFDPIGTVSAVVPAGSFVERAFLYSSYGNNFTSAPQSISVTFDNVTYGQASFTSVGGYVKGPDFRLEAYRADVTNHVRGVIGSGGGTFNFVVNSESPNLKIDGEMLVVIYSNPSERRRNIVLAEGQSYNPVSPYSRTSTIAWPTPLSPASEGEFLLSTGIGFSSHFPGSNQYMTLDVNGRRLTTSAGGEDDGTSLEGALITAGGLGDVPTNPSPFALPSAARSDDEYYNLALGNSADANPFLNGGETSFSLQTTNHSSANDLMFFVGFNATVVPEPSAAGFIAMSMFWVMVRRSRLRVRA